MKALISTLLLVLVSQVAFAANIQGTAVTQVQVRNKPVTVYELATITAPATDQGMNGFAKQVGYWLHEWTRTHGVEAIGNLCHTPDNKTWGTIILTIYAHTTSPKTNACPQGMINSGTTIHSHPQRHRYQVNSVDRLFLHDGLRAENEIATWPDRYSPEDLAEGPGYLVGLLALHYQDGRGHIHRVKYLNTPEQMPQPTITLN